MGPDVHFRLTFDWARESGFATADAERIARADVAVDSQFPARRSIAALSRHFAPTAWLWALAYYRRAVVGCDLISLGRALHCVQDVYSHGWLALAHVRFNLGVGRNPDDWDGAPAWERKRIESITRRVLERYVRACQERSGRL